MTPTPTPRMAVIAEHTEASLERLRVLFGGLDRLVFMRYVSYEEAQAFTISLAEQVRKAVGGDLQRSRFVALSRSGHIVLGMLAIALGLGREQLYADGASDTPLVCVDDSVLSGLRLRQTLERHPDAQNIVVATLSSHPQLRHAVLAQEPQVEAFLSILDLSDLPVPSQNSERFDALVRNLPGKRYWQGRTNYTVFPWGEPDHPFWNPVTQQVEYGWRIVPPELCFKNRPAQPVEYDRVIQWQPRGKGTLRPSKRAVFGRYRNQMVVCNLDSGRCLALSDVAGAMWSAVVEHGELAAAARLLAAEYDVETGRLAEDLRRFVEEMIGLGLLDVHRQRRPSQPRRSN